MEKAAAGEAGPPEKLSVAAADESGGASGRRLSEAGLVTEVAKLTAGDTATFDYFGSVAIDGSYAVVGAWNGGNSGTYDDSDYFGNEDGTGAAYIFEMSGGSWTQVAKLVADDAASGDQFGSAVAISGNYAVVGANRKSGYRGAAYIFDISALGAGRRLDSCSGEPVSSAACPCEVWTIETCDEANCGEVCQSDGGECGTSTSLDNCGIYDVYTKVCTPTFAPTMKPSNAEVTINQVAKLVDADAGSGDYFGGAVAISGDYAVCGASGDDNTGHQSNSGSAYVFGRNSTDGSWSQVVDRAVTNHSSG